MDTDGYPTDEELDKIRKWPHRDARGWFAFVKERWNLAEWGWSEETDDGLVLYQISTGGWSGKESLIEAMGGNRMLWMLTWYSSRRGGHYEFRARP